MAKRRNIFAGNGERKDYVVHLYNLLIEKKEGKRRFVSYDDVLASRFGAQACEGGDRRKDFDSYTELKKAFLDVRGRLKGYIVSNGKNGKGVAYKYIGEDDDPLREERLAVVKKRVDDYVTFCKESAQMFPKGWVEAFFENTQMLLDMRREEQDGEGHITTSSEQSLRNIQLLPEFNRAIIQRRVLEFAYKPYTLEEERLVFHPQFLKEYRRRWFVFGKAEGKEDYPFTVGLERVNSEVKEYTGLKYEMAEKGLYRRFFENIIGVTHEKGAKTETIVLATYTKYVHCRLTTKILHHSQTETKPFDDIRGEGEIQLRVEPNRELTTILLSYGSEIEVKAPIGLRAEIRNILSRQVGLYEASSPFQKLDADGQ